ncbi:hypothetical protein HBB16_06060 [Pseudonocardia sp. MCCB 268]|nr:hypothetical protein [Pseudonocardia cytotoxica]
MTTNAARRPGSRTRRTPSCSAGSPVPGRSPGRRDLRHAGARTLGPSW